MELHDSVQLMHKLQCVQAALGFGNVSYGT